MKPENLPILIQKYLSGSASEEELQQLHTWYRSQDHSLVEWHANGPDEEEQVRNRIFSTIDAHIGAEKTLKISRLKWLKIAAAAAILVIASSGIYFFMPKQVPLNTSALHFKNDIAPGKNKAVLKLADGTQVMIDDTKTEQIATQGNVQIRKTADGQLIYDLTTRQSSGQMSGYNTIITPSGGKYQIVLPDGTKVWLNAVSSIRFPVHFSNTERNVETSGEVYFEVAKNKALPFRVRSGEQTIEVLGTHFNVNAYHDDQNIRTTLLEGSIKIRSSDAAPASILKPGQVALINTVEKNSPVQINEADVEESIAWKNDLFIFNNAKIEQVMLQVKRWYNIELVYNGAKPDLLFTGVIPRNRNLSSILNVLESTGGVKFGIEGKKIIVQKFTN